MAIKINFVAAKHQALHQLCRHKRQWRSQKILVDEADFGIVSLFW